MILHCLSLCIFWCLFISNVFLLFQVATKTYISRSDCLLNIHCIVKAALDSSSASHLQTDTHNKYICNLEL